MTYLRLKKNCVLSSAEYRSLQDSVHIRAVCTLNLFVDCFAIQDETNQKRRSNQNHQTKKGCRQSIRTTTLPQTVNLQSVSDSQN